MKKKPNYPKWKEQYEIPSRPVQQRKKNERQFYDTVKQTAEEREQAKRIEAARNAGYKLDKPVQIHRVNPLAVAFWIAILIILMVVMLWKY